MLQPMRTCRLRLWALYWVAMKILRSPEFTQLDRVKSMMRYGPSEAHGRLGPVLGQGVQALAGTPGQEDRGDVAEEQHVHEELDHGWRRPSAPVAELVLGVAAVPCRYSTAREAAVASP